MSKTTAKLPTRGLRRVLHWSALCLLGLLLALFGVLLAAPNLLPWTGLARGFLPSLLEEKGYRADLTGEVEVRSLIPLLDFKIGSLRLYEEQQSNPAFAFESLEGRGPLFDLLDGRIVVDRIALQRPLLDLTDFALSSSTQEEELQQAKTIVERAFEEVLDDILDVARGFTPDLAIQSLEVMQGSLRLPIESGEETLSLGEITLTGERQTADSPLALWSDFYLDGLPSQAFVTIDNLTDLGATTPLRFEIGLENDLIHGFATGQAALGDNKSIQADLQIKSAALSELGRWLRIPTGAGQAGKVVAYASLSADSEGLSIEEFDFEGDSIDVSGDGRLSWPAKGQPIDAYGNLTVSRLLLDPVIGLMPKQDLDLRPPFAAFGPMIGSKQIDLSFLRDLDLDFHVRAQDISLAGEIIGPISFDSSAREGLITAMLGNLDVAGGRLLGNISLDARKDQMILSSDLAIDGVSLKRIAEIAGQDATMVAGQASGYLRLDSIGDNPRDLIAGLSGELLLDAGGVEVENEEDGQFSDIKLDLQLPKDGGRPYLLASFRRDDKPIWIDLETGPLATIVDRAPFQVDLIAGSPLGQLRFDGQILQRPLPGLDGRLTAELPDPAALADWFGVTLASTPGAIKLDAVFVGDGLQNRLEPLIVTGGGLDLKAQGSIIIDDSGARSFDFEIDAGELLLTPYLSASSDLSDGAGGPSSQELELLASWSGKAQINAQAVSADDFKTGRTTLAVSLADSHFSVDAKTSGLLGGSAEGAIEAPLAEGSGNANLALYNIDAAPLLSLLGLTDIALTDNLSGTLKASFGPLLQGASVTAASIKAELPVFSHASLPDRSIAGGKLSTSFEGNQLSASISGGTISGTGLEPLPIGMSAEVRASGALPEGLKQAQTTLEFKLADTTVTFVGQLPGDSVPLEGQLKFKTHNVDTSLRIANVDLLLGLEFDVSARVLQEDTSKIRFSDMSASIGRSDLSGHGSFDFAGELPVITADLVSNVLDLDELTAGTSVVEPLNEEAPANRVIPTDEIVPVELLQSLEGDLVLEVAEFRSFEGLEANDAAFEAHLAAGILDFKILRSTFETFGGSGKLDLRIDSNPVEPDVLLTMAVRDADYGSLFKAFDITQEVSGEMDLDMNVRGHGRSIAAIAATTSGFSRIIAEDGSIDTSMLDILAFGATDLLRPFFGDSNTNNMKCFINAIDYEDGIGTLRIQFLDARRFQVAGRGSLNLKDETLSLTFSPSSSVPKLLSFVVPFNVGGTFAFPSVVPSPTGSLLQIGKIVGSIVNPLVGLGILAADTALANLDSCSAAAAIAKGEIEPSHLENPRSQQRRD